MLRKRIIQLILNRVKSFFCDILSNIAKTKRLEICRAFIFHANCRTSLSICAEPWATSKRTYQEGISSHTHTNGWSVIGTENSRTPGTVTTERSESISLTGTHNWWGGALREKHMCQILESVVRASWTPVVGRINCGSKRNFKRTKKRSSLRRRCKALVYRERNTNKHWTKRRV